MHEPINQWTHDHTWEVISQSSHAIQKRCTECGFALAIGCGGCPKCVAATLPLAIVDEHGRRTDRLVTVS